MNYYDDENSIIESFQCLNDSSVFFPIFTDDAEEVYRSIHDLEEWNKWTNSAGKSDPPPDYFNDEKQLMMDVMIVEDNSFIGKKGKPVNPTKKQESLMRKELEKIGILESFPHLEKIMLIAHTGLPTKEDHNYIFYRDNFNRVIKNHISKIGKYNENHRGYKKIFLIMDESTAYIQTQNLDHTFAEGDMIPAKIHFHFFDKAFLDAFFGSEIDYLIWYTPYKHVWTDKEKLNLPQAVIYDVKNMDFNKIVYDPLYMMSNEA